MKLGDRTAILAGAAVGGAFGAGYAAAVRKPSHFLVAGSAYGIGVWAALEGVIRVAPNPPQGWGFKPPVRYALAFGAFGAAVAWAVEW